MTSHESKNVEKSSCHDPDFQVTVRNINDNMKCTVPFGTCNRMREGKDSWILLKKTT